MISKLINFFQERRRQAEVDQLWLDSPYIQSILVVAELMKAQGLSILTINESNVKQYLEDHHIQMSPIGRRYLREQHGINLSASTDDCAIFIGKPTLRVELLSQVPLTFSDSHK